jgi:hypothetical protein
MMRALVDAPELHAGLLAGLVLLVVLVPVCLLGGMRRGHGREGTGTRAPVLPLLGPAIVGGTVAVIAGWGPFEEIWPVPARVPAGLAVLWLAGEVARRTSRPGLVGPAIAVVGGALLVEPRAHFPDWVTALLLVGPGLAGAAAADLDRRGAAFGIGTILFAISTVALYTTVPDTELVLPLLGVTAPLVVLAWPAARARLGSGGAYAAAGLFLWIGVLEGSGREGSIVGGAAALGVLVAEPVGRALASRRRDRTRVTRQPNPGALVAAQVVVAAWTARVAGMLDEPLLALAVALPAAVAAVAVGVRFGLAEPGPRTAPPRRRAPVDRSRVR